MTPETPRAVLFDLDGVLIDSFEAWLRLVRRARRDMGFGGLTREEFARGFGQGVEDDAELLFPGRTVAEVDAVFNSGFMDEIEHVEVFPDARPTLEELRRRGHALAIVTNTRNVLAAAMLEALGFAGLVDEVVASGDVPREKPAPDMPLEACRRLGASVERAAMVGDSRYDREAAGAAGILFIGYRTEGDRRVERLGEIPDLVAELG